MIIYFSGTGNSEAVAKYLSASLSEDVTVIRPGASFRPETAGSRIIWIFPVYGWDMPPVVSEFITGTILPDNNLPHYMVAVCGDDIGLTALNWKKLINSKGWTPKAMFSVQMPNNYVCLPGFDVDPEPLEHKKLGAMPMHVESIASMILAGNTGEHTVRGKFAWVKSRVISPVFRKFLMKPSGFNVNEEKCIGCGKCAGCCPCGNISMKKDKPVWSDNCAFCLRCYHVCPVNAIGYGKWTINKGQYLCPQVFK